MLIFTSAFNNFQCYFLFAIMDESHKVKKTVRVVIHLGFIGIKGVSIRIIRYKLCYFSGCTIK